MGTITRTRSPRKPAKETHGKAFISTGNLTIQEALDRGELLLTLHTDTCTNYLVQRLSDPDGETVGFRMMKLTDYIVDRKVYDIDVCCGKDWLCDCPDAQFQNRECKHVRSLRAALASNGITVGTPKPEPKPAAREPWCHHCNDDRNVYCSHCAI